MRRLRLVIGGLTLAAMIGVAGVHRARPLIALGLLGMVTALGVLADIDLRTQLLPNRIVAPLALAVVAGVALAGVAYGEFDRSGQAVATGAAFVVVTVLLHLIGGMGMGDVKLSFPIGVIAGWFGGDAVMATVAVAAASGLVAAIFVLLSRGRGEFSYGPYLALGSVAGMLIGGQA